MSIKWFNRKPGERPVSQEEDGSVCVVFGDTSPDWVELPPQLGGGKRRVERMFHSACPCKQQHSVSHLSLGKGLYVAECKHKGFLWYGVAGKD